MCASNVNNINELHILYSDSVSMLVLAHLKFEIQNLISHHIKHVLCFRF